MTRPRTPAARTAWLRLETLTQQQLHGLSRFEARDAARRKLFLLDVDAARDVADVRALLREIATEVVWRS